MENVKNHFNGEAAEFDEIVLKLIPFYREMLEALVFSVPFAENEKISILDLGSGTGEVARVAKKRFPGATITCVDMAGNMLDMARQKLGELDNIEFVQADFSTFKTMRKYDVVLSSLAIHHLYTDDDKKEFFKKIIDWLNPGGAFFNADVVLAETEYLQSSAMNKWIAYMMRSVSMKEINESVLPRYKREDYPAKLRNQLAWMDEAGFHGVDLIWKYYNFAVYGGYKQ